MWVKTVNASQTLVTIAPATVTATAARITSAQLFDQYKAVVGVVLTADPANASTIYIGDESVTINNGTPLVPGEKISLPVSDPYSIYAVAASGSNILRIGKV